MQASILRFALKTLLHQRAKSFAGLCGVSFAVCLALVQIGMYHGAMSSASAVIDHSNADLWVVPRGAQNFDFTQPVEEYVLYLVRSVPGVEKVEPLVVAFSLWKLPTGGLESVEVIGFDTGGEMIRPWNVVVGSPTELEHDRNVFIDGGDLKKLHVRGVGDHAELYLEPSLSMRANIVGLTEKVKSFVASPMVMTSYKNSIGLCQLKEGNFSYLLVRVAPGWDKEEVRRAIERSVDRIEAFTREDFAKKTQSYWDEATGLGMALFAAAFMGVLIGVGTVAMILYMSTLDHLPQYATLKALGVPNHRVVRLVALQALIVGLCGYAVGLTFAINVQRSLEAKALYVLLSPGLILSVFVGTLLFCSLASLLSAVKIVRLDPGVVFHT